MTLPEPLPPDPAGAFPPRAPHTRPSSKPKEWPGSTVKRKDHEDLWNIMEKIWETLDDLNILYIYIYIYCIYSILWDRFWVFVQIFESWFAIPNHEKLTCLYSILWDRFWVFVQIFESWFAIPNHEKLTIWKKILHMNPVIWSHKNVGITGGSSQCLCSEHRHPGKTPIGPATTRMTSPILKCHFWFSCQPRVLVVASCLSWGQ